jgi:hypothetical protein
MMKLHATLTFVLLLSGLMFSGTQAVGLDNEADLSITVDGTRQ